MARRRTPTELRLVNGTPNRHKNDDEPKPEGKPVMPGFLDGRARVYWKQYARLGFWLTEADSMKLAAFCGICAEIEADLAGMPTARITTWRSLGSELGFDPSSRPKLSGGSRKPKSAASRFFK